MRYYLAIDIGASSGRHILAHLENGKMITEEIYRFQNGPKMRTAYDGKEHLTWDPEALFAEILNGLKKAKEAGKTPYSVGIDTWGVDYVLLDEDDKAIGGVYCYRDARTEETIPAVHKIIPFETLYEKTGIQFASYNTVYQLLHDKITGRLAKAKTFLMLPDYFHFRLTGVKKQEYTNATTTGMVNVNTHSWDEGILGALGYNKELFGDLSQPGMEVGEFSDEVAGFVGYKAKVVLPATHDTASAVLAAPLSGQTPYLSSGTWSILGVERNKAFNSAAAREAGYSNEGSIHYGVRLQINIMGLWMIQQVRHEYGDKYDFAQLAEMAKANPIEDEINVNDQKFLAPESMIDAIEESVGRKLSVGETAYVIYNNLARFYKQALSALEGVTGETYETLNIIGGGSKNNLLNELTARYTGKKIVTGPAEGTAIGNLMLQMVGCGEIADVKAGREIVKRSFDITEL
ncbi:MAG: rhamnulokinase family protein [Candidatus Borkfalkiaceae bacterium]|nr:rhamnulokinase [Clostridia bacterium]MDY6223436.1 rhamnulokinase family protein [Christensenellaceae bacterium]